MEGSTEMEGRKGMEGSTEMDRRKGIDWRKNRGKDVSEEKSRLGNKLKLKKKKEILRFVSLQEHGLKREYFLAWNIDL